MGTLQNLPAAGLTPDRDDLSKLWNESLELFAIADFDGCFKYLSPHWEPTLGYPIETLVGRPYNDFVHPDDVESTTAETESLTKAGDLTISFENRYRHADGSYRTLKWTSRPDPEREQIYAIAHDVTRLRASERDARTAAAERDLILSTAGVGIFRLDLNGDATYANEETASMLACSVDDLIGGRMHELSHHSHADGSPYPIEECPIHTSRTAGQTLIRVRERFWPLDGGDSFPVELTSAPLHEGGEITGAVVVFTDVTEQLAAEKLSAHYAEMLERQVSDRTAELEAFTYTVSHDLRTPLRSITGFAEVLAEEHGDELSEDARRYTGFMAAAAEQMAELIDDLLAFSQLSRAELKRRTCDPAVVAARALAEASGGKDLPAGLVTIEPIPNCEADPALLLRVYVNLIANAVKFAGARSDPHVNIGARHEDGEMVYFVSDNGVGFDNRYAEKIFGVFERLHKAEEFPGTGVGLAIVERIISRHGGRVWAEAEPNQGATFSFTLAPGNEGNEDA